MSFNIGMMFLSVALCALTSSAAGGRGSLSTLLDSGSKGAGTNRQSIITADKIEYDNKEGVILFDRNVKVDDARFLMKSDRLLLFMDGTNDSQEVQQIMAVGNVSISNDTRSAKCDRAVYTRKEGQIVMTGNASLSSGGERSGTVIGNRIVFWLDDERMEVFEGSRVILPPGMLGGKDKNSKKEAAEKGGISQQ